MGREIDRLFKGESADEPDFELQIAGACRTQFDPKVVVPPLVDWHEPEDNQKERVFKAGKHNREMGVPLNDLSSLASQASSKHIARRSMTRSQIQTAINE